MEISKASAWVVIFYCNSTLLKCGSSKATNQSWCCPSLKFMLASRIVHFSLWSSSQGFLLGCIAISLNPTIDYASDLGLLNSLFNVAWMSTTPSFGLSLEYLIYQVSTRYCRELSSVTFFIWSSVTPWASHKTLTTNQNWFGSSFPKPLRKGSFTEFAMLNCSGGGGGMGEVIGDNGVGGGRNHGNPCLINWTTLRRESCTTPSSSPNDGDTSGLYSWPFLPSFL